MTDASLPTVTVMFGTSVAGLLWTGSLGWLEHPADNREVAGSNPAMPTNNYLPYGVSIF